DAHARPECLLSGSRIDCFATDQQGNLVHIASTDGVNWPSPWQALAANVTTEPSCVHLPSSVITCFVGRTASSGCKHLWSVALASGASLHAVGPSLNVAGRPSCVAVVASASIQCVLLDADRATPPGVAKSSTDATRPEIWRVTQGNGGQVTADWLGLP